jgi:hypothetical protein
VRSVFGRFSGIENIRCLADDVACRVIQTHVECFPPESVLNGIAAGSNSATQFGGGLPDDLGPVVINRFGRAVLVWYTKDP